MRQHRPRRLNLFVGFLKRTPLGLIGRLGDIQMIGVGRACSADSRGEGAGGGEDLEGCKTSKDCGNAAFSKRFRFLTMRIHMTTHPTTVLYKHA